MKAWRFVLWGTLTGSALWASACGSEDAKKQPQPGEAGAAGEDSSGAGKGGSNGNGGTAGTSAGGVPGAGAPGDAGAPGENGGTNAGAGNGDAGAGGGSTVLTSCDAPLVVDDAAEASIAPNTPAVFQAPGGGLALLIWREGQLRKGRVLDGDTLGEVFTFPNGLVSSEQYPHYVAARADGFAYSNAGEPSVVLTYDQTTDSWSDPDPHAGLDYDMLQFLSNGDTLHVVTDATASTGALQTRSKQGVWSVQSPVWSWAPEKLGLPRLLVDAQDRGAIVGGRQPDTKQLVGWALRDGAVVAQATTPIGGILTALHTAVLPNGDVLAIFQHDGDPLTRAATLSYDANQDNAEWSPPVTVIEPASRVMGMAVDGNGDVTLHYGLALGDEVRRRIGGVWGEPQMLPYSEQWLADPLVDGASTTFLARAADFTTLEILSASAGESTWSEPVDVVGNFGWSGPQRPRLGLHASGKPLVVWQGTNGSGGTDILLSLCH